MHNLDSRTLTHTQQLGTVKMGETKVFIVHCTSITNFGASCSGAQGRADAFDELDKVNNVATHFGI